MCAASCSIKISIFSQWNKNILNLNIEFTFCFLENSRNNSYCSTCPPQWIHSAHLSLEYLIGLFSKINFQHSFSLFLIKLSRLRRPFLCFQINLKFKLAPKFFFIMTYRSTIIGVIIKLIKIIRCRLLIWFSLFALLLIIFGHPKIVLRGYPLGH